MWVKICGLTNLADAQTAAAAGADALGFVFAESPRKVTPETVDEIVAALRGKAARAVPTYGVFASSQDPEEIGECVQRSGVTGVQMHTDDPVRQVGLLRKALDRGTSIIAAIRVPENPEDLLPVITELDAAAQEAASKKLGVKEMKIDAIHLDHGRGGTGLPFDWAVIAAALGKVKIRTPIIVAGGLTQWNVSEAIHTLRPWGVDVSGGVEVSPRLKDPEKIRSFISAARKAAALSGAEQRSARQ